MVPVALKNCQWKPLMVIPAGLLGGWATLQIVSGQRTVAVVLLGGVVSIVLGLLPFRFVCSILIASSIVTRVAVPLGGFHMRIDMALMPAGVLSCLLSGYGSQFMRWLRHPVIKALGGFVFINVLTSAFTSPDIVKSESIAAWYGIDLIILVLALACFSDRRTDLRKILFSAGWLAVGTGVLAWFAALAVGSAPGANYDPQVGLRAYGISFEPNILAGIAGMWIVVLLSESRRLRRSEVAFCLVGLATIPLTGTRAAVIAIACGASVAAFSFGRGSRVLGRLMLSGTVFLGSAILVAAEFPAVSSRLIGKILHLNLHNSTATSRYTAWDTAVHDLHGVHWLIGLGTNSFGMRHIEPTSIYQAVPSPGYLGNLPLNILYDTGLVGLLCLGVALCLLIQLAPARSRRMRRVAVSIAFIIIATGTSPFFFSYYWLFMAIALLPTVANNHPRLGALEDLSANSEGVSHRWRRA